MDRWERMNNPLELTGRVLGLSRPEPGRVLIVGARRDRRRLARCLGQGPWAGLPVVGFVDAGHPRYAGRLGRRRQLVVHPRTDPVPVLGDIDRLDELVDRSGATHVVVAISGRPAKRLWPRVAHLRNSDVAVHWVTEDGGVPAETAVATSEGDADWTVTRPVWPLAGERVAKRVFDLIGAALGLAILSPLFMVVSILILVTTGRPILYSQERIGQGCRIFRMLKFRSMRRDAEGATGPVWASDHDSRCTAVGAWLRRTNIDELPQLVNVFRGEMSLVGPRPERPIFVERFRTTIADYDLRHVVAGGMTGWAQVHGWRGRTSLRKRIQYDLDYIQRWSFWFDLRILLMTFQHVVWGKTSWTSAKRKPET
jgi:exopolysaccharide biosynthesis polyprenyl glycosylphosphotransferase